MEIPWINCLSLCTDNANTMIGKKNGLYGCLLQQQGSLYSTGCACHRLHLAAEWASKELLINTDSFFLDIYCYMDKSANWLQVFQACQKEADAVAH